VGGKTTRLRRKSGPQGPEPEAKFPSRQRVRLWYSIDLCEDARPSAPTMSYGSRANQVNPEALVILFRATT
jgi:hypothetical protein